MPEFEECIVPHNSPREDDYDGSEWLAWEMITHLRNSQNEIKFDGRSSDPSGSPGINLPHYHVDKSQKRVSFVEDWQEIPSDLLTRDSVWNVLCKIYHQIGHFSRSEYFQCVMEWRRDLETTSEKVRQTYPLCERPPLTTKLVHQPYQDQRVLIEYDKAVKYCHSYSNDNNDKFVRNEKQQTYSKVLPDNDIQPRWRRDLQEKLRYTTIPSPPPGLPPSRRRATRPGSTKLLSVDTLEIQHPTVNCNANLQMQVPHKGGNIPMCRPLKNGHEPNTNTGKERRYQKYSRRTQTHKEREQKMMVVNLSSMK